MQHATFPPTLSGVFDVTVDHFQFADARRFGLRYLGYSAFAKGPTAPVLFYCGNEGAIELFYNATGALFEHASALGAHAFFIEHRYYGTSTPFGPNASFTPEGLRFLTIEQALADYSEVILSLPRILGCSGTGARATAGRCDVVLFGGSYGGMLAAWHRLKSPFLSVGAIASGAPIDFYSGDGVQGRFLDAVTYTFDKYGGHAECKQAFTAALTAADAASNEDLEAAGVRPCQPFESDSAERYAFYARGALASLALADYPYAANFIAPLPANPVQAACAALLATLPNVAEAEASGWAARAGRGRADAVPSARVPALAALHRAVLGLVNASCELRCVDLGAELVGRVPSRGPSPRGGQGLDRGVDASRTSAASAPGDSPLPRALEDSALGVTAWNYQACTELLLEPLTSDGFGFYPPSEAQLDKTIAICRDRFGVEPRPRWPITAFGRGADFAFASNLVFVENDKDPWHVGTETVTNSSSVTRVLAEGGAHHQDLRSSSPLDAPGVVRARAYERETMRQWLAPA